MKVLVVGSGFGGVKAALELSDLEGVDVSIMSPRLSFEYHAALYRSATGWSPREVLLPLRDIIDNRHIELIQDKLVNLDVDRHMVWGETGESYSYDRLILSIGQVTSYYGIEGMDEHSWSMDTVNNTIQLRYHLKEQALSSSKKLKFIIIGAGATGVEVASEIALFIAELGRAHSVEPKNVEVLLIEGSMRVLPALSPKISKMAEKRLIELGVDIRLDTQVSKSEAGIVYVGDEKIKTDSIIWTAGFTNNPFFKNHEGVFRLAKNSRVEVDEYLQATQDVFVIGDSAQTQYSGMAQTALHDANFVSENIKKELKGKEKSLYVPKRPIYVVPVGPQYAVLQWGSMVLWGKPAWFLRRIADFKLFSNFEPLYKAIKTWRAGDTRAKWLDID